MIEKLKQMWDALLSRIGVAKRQLKGENLDPGSQSYHDIAHINWIASAITKLANLSCNEATFDIISDSAQANELKRLCKDVEKHRFEIVSGMLGDGNYYIVPATDHSGRLYHSYQSNDNVKIIAMDGDKITELYIVLDFFEKRNGARYNLIRHHKLDGDTLTVDYLILDNSGFSAKSDYWGDITGVKNIYKGAKNIGLGWYKSPKDSRGESLIYGVPLNFGCSEIERKINDLLIKIADEFNSTVTKLFADESVVKASEDNKQWKISEHIYPIRKKAGVDGNLIDIFSPNIRTSVHWETLIKYLEIYEQMIGVNKGILTENTAMMGGTATAVKRSNSDTIALIDNIHTALDAGNKMLFEADAMFLNVRPELFDYKSDYFDPFLDPSEQFNWIMQGVNAGALQKRRLTEWLYPSMSEDEINSEIEAISASESAGATQAIAKALNIE